MAAAPAAIVAGVGAADVAVAAVVTVAGVALAARVRLTGLTEAIREASRHPLRGRIPLRPPMLPIMETTPAVRVDKWLWAVRVFRTRSAAAAACTAGKVKMNGSPVKPARAVRTGDVIEANNGTLTRTVKVITPIENRVGAALVSRHLEELTPAAEIEAARERAAAPVGYRPPGTGRPTKRDRRILQSFFGRDE